MNRYIAPLAVAGIALAGMIVPHTSVGAVADPAATIFISEIHYRGGGGQDSNEGVEVTAPATTDLTGWTIWLYDGATGSQYQSSIPVGGVVPGATGELGAIAVFPGPYGGNQGNIENGDPDGIALVDPSENLVQFLSYGGSFVASGGPADGRSSTDIGVVESGNSGNGESLQLVHVAQTYGSYGDFEWQGPLTSNWGVAPADTGTPPPNGDGGTAVGEFTLVDAPGPCIVISAGSSVTFPDLTIGTGDASPGDVDTEIDSCSTNDIDPQSVAQAISSAAGVNGGQLSATLCPTVPLQFVLPGTSPTFDCGVPPTATEFGYGGFSTTDLANWASVVDTNEAFTDLTIEPLGSTTVSHAIVGPDLGAVADTYQFELTYTAFFG